MRAFGFREHGGFDRLEFLDLPSPTPGPGEVRIEVKAAAFNRVDRFTLEGIPGVPIDRPHVLGSDGSGVVDSLGPDVNTPDAGTSVLINPGLVDGTCDSCQAGHPELCRNLRIVGEHTQGTAAKYVVVPRQNVYPIPPGRSFEEAAAFPLVFQTVWRALKTVGQVERGDRVAVIGAGGGTATTAVLVAKMLGASVAVAARDGNKARRALELGADAALTYSESDPLERVLWRWSEKRGVDVIFDSVGAPTVASSVKALARGGRVVVIGATAGPMVTFDLRTLFWRQASVRGSTMASPKEFEEVYAEFASGGFRPVIDRVYPFDDALSAFHRLDSPDLFGKVVLRLG